jgi:predicted GNAT family acetyltransferase
VSNHRSPSFGTLRVGAIITRPRLLKERLVETLRVHALTDHDERDVQAFLSLRPVHTVYMAGLIQDNGLVSPLNRGRFYAYRSPSAQLEGVALMGPKMVFEARSRAALEAFAELALENPARELIRGDEEQIELLADLLSRRGRNPRRVCRELLLEQRAPVEGVPAVPDLRHARWEELDQVASINAMMLSEEHGVNTFERDPEGALQRLGRRIEQGRVWVLYERGRITFKADVISETPQAAFIEGVYVHPQERGRGCGFRCMTQLARNLLAHTSALCLVVNEENGAAQSLYKKAGYRLCSRYCTIYF